MILSIGVALLAPLLLIDVLQLSVSAGDEGVILVGASRVLHGQLPYRDFFSIVTPGSYYLLASFFKVFGESLLTARALHWLIYAGTLAVFLGLMSRLGLPLRWKLVGIWATMSMGPPFWCIFSHHWLANLGVLASGLLLLQSQTSRKTVHVFLSGLVAGTTFLCLQDEGLYWTALAAVALFFADRESRWKAPATFASAAALMVGAVFLPLLTRVPVAAVWGNLVLSPLTGYHGAAGNRVSLAEGWTLPLRIFMEQWRRAAGLSGLPNLLSSAATFVGTVLVLMFLFTAVVLVAHFLICWRRRAKGDSERFLVLAAMVLSLLLTALHRPAMLNLVWAFPGALLMVLWWIGSRNAGVDKKTNWGLALALGAPFLVMGLANIILVPLTASSALYKFPAGTVRSYIAPEQESLVLAQSFRARSYRPGDRVLCYSYNAIFYFLLRLENATYYDTYNSGMYSQAEKVSFMEALEKSPPEWILWDRNAVKGESMLEWMGNRYTVVGVSPSLAILRSKAMPPRG